MNVSPSKENILKKIRKALTQSTPLPFPQSEGNSSVYHPSKQELEIEFAEQFTRLQGKFAFCLNEQELAAQLAQLVADNKLENLYCRSPRMQEMLTANGFTQFRPVELEQCDAAVTDCEWLVARTGSIVLSSAQAAGRTVSVYAPVHICIAYTSQLVYDVKDALIKAKEKYGSNIPSLLTFATGPSRTADIEKTLVVGVHGPREVFVFLVDQ